MLSWEMNVTGVCFFFFMSSGLDVHDVPLLSPAVPLRPGEKNAVT